MPDTRTATVAGQSIALHITGYPDLPNRWGSGHIRSTGIRLDYGNGHTPNGRHALVTGTWVREDGEVTTDPIDRYYDAHDGDTSDWPDWLAQLVKAHDPSAVPVSSPPPDQTAHACDNCSGIDPDTCPFNPNRPSGTAAVVPPPPSRAATLTDTERNVLRSALDMAEEEMLARGDDEDQLEALNALRRLAAEAQPPCAECGHAYADHEEGEDPVSPGRCRACEDDFGWHNYQPTQAQQPGAETEAHPPTHAWRVETRDPGNAQWTPGSHFAHRPAAVERWETANRTAPLWNDGTPVKRRIVRETTTYTVDQPATTDGTGRV